MFRMRMDLPISKNENIQWKLIEDKAVLLEIDEGIVFELDDMASKIWLTIDGRKTGKDIVDYLVENFEVERAQAERDLYRFLKDLFRAEVINLV